MCLETRAEQMAHRFNLWNFCTMNYGSWERIKTVVLLTLNVFGNSSRHKLARRVNLCSFYIMNYSSYEHVQKSMFSSPEMCLETIAEK